MGRISRGFRLAGISWRVLLHDPQLLVLPLLSFVGIAASAVAALAVGEAVGVSFTISTRHASAAQWVLLAAFYVASSIVTIFFNAALVAAATIRLRGGEPRLAEGLSIAATRLHVIVVWGIITATVGLIIRAIQDRVPLVANITVAVLGAAWGVATYFVVPVLVFEHHGIPGSVKRSTHLVAQRWGEGLVGNGLIGGALFLATLPVLFACAAFIVISPPLGIGLLALGLVLLIAVTRGLTGIFDAALYRYAVTAEVPGPWMEDDLRAAFRARRRRNR